MKRPLAALVLAVSALALSGCQGGNEDSFPTNQVTQPPLPGEEGEEGSDSGPAEADPDVDPTSAPS